MHSGFASPASGDFNTQLKKEFTARIEQLLSAKPPQRAIAATSSKTAVSGG